MSSVKKTKIIQNHHVQYIPTLNQQQLRITEKTYQEEIQSQSSEDQEHKAIVEALFNQQDNKIMSHHYHEKQDQEDQDIKSFLSQQVPGLYNEEHNEQEFSQFRQEQQDEDDFTAYLSPSIAPQYYTMSRYQKVNFFDNLNSLYMARLNYVEKQKSNQPKCIEVGQLLEVKSDNEVKQVKQNGQANNPTLPQQSVQLHTLTPPANQTPSQSLLQQSFQPLPKPKRSIRFNQTVYQVPFNKQQQPCVIRNTPQQQTWIRYDSACIQSQYRHQPAQNEYMNSSYYFDDLESEEMEDLPSSYLSGMCRNSLRMYLGEDEDDYSEEDIIIMPNEQEEEQQDDSEEEQYQEDETIQTHGEKNQKFKRENDIQRMKQRKIREKQLFDDLDLDLDLDCIQDNDEQENIEKKNSISTIVSSDEEENRFIKFNKFKRDYIHRNQQLNQIQSSSNSEEQSHSQDSDSLDDQLIKIERPRKINMENFILSPAIEKALQSINPKQIKNKLLQNMPISEVNVNQNKQTTQPQSISSPESTIQQPIDSNCDQPLEALIQLESSATQLAH